MIEPFSAPEMLTTTSICIVFVPADFTMDPVYFPSRPCCASADEEQIMHKAIAGKVTHIEVLPDVESPDVDLSFAIVRLRRILITRRADGSELSDSSYSRPMSNRRAHEWTYFESLTSRMAPS